MYTRCPKCLTCFRVTDRHLAIANGKVRCGQCQHIFNAPQHAVDDLPLNQSPAKTAPTPVKPAATSAKSTISPPASTQDKKTVTTVRTTEEIIQPAEKIRPPEKSTTVIAAKERSERIQEPVKPREIKTEKPEIKKADVLAPTFNADATMIVDTASIKKDDILEIDLALPANTSKETVKKIPDKTTPDFTDSYDLNAAIEELTQENNKASKRKTAQPPTEKPAQPETSSDNIFSTDAYDATSATSVADVFDEIGQLSLDIPSPDTLASYNADDEFEFINLDDEITVKDEPGKAANKDKDEVKTTKEKSVEQQFLDEFDLKNDESEDMAVNADELFDQIDISDFDDELTENTQTAFRVDNPDRHFSHSENNEIPFQLRNDIDRLQAPQRRKWHPIFSLIFILILLSTSFTQLAYFRAHELVKVVPAAQPWLEMFCTKAGCLYSGPRDIRQIQLISRDVRQHPKEKNALLISAAMLNQADFAQPYPDIHIRLSDISGNVVAERVFNAKTYMGKLSNPFLLMKSKTPVHINFEVIDPGKDAVNFEFTFK